MGYSKRIRTLCSLLEKSKTFADVGCDHGYCSEYALKSGLCEQVIFSDISKGSLQKAEKLLQDFVKENRAKGVLGNGFFGVPSTTEQVLIAGMGGSEIVSILSDEKYGFMPARFVFQPMHDSEKLRRYILENGGIIERDFTFFDGKFYDVIVGRKAKAGEKPCEYSNLQFEFGKENLQKMPPDFIKKVQKLLKNTEKYLQIESLKEESKAELLQRKSTLQGVLQGEIE